MEMEETAACLRGIFAVQPFNRLRAETDQGIGIVWATGRIHRIRKQRKMEVLVPIPKETYLESLNHLARLGLIQKQGRYGHHSKTVVGNAFRQIEFRQNSRRKEKSDQLINHVDGGPSGGHKQQRQEDGHRDRPPTGQKQASCQHESAELDS